jgi:hypothetical protein
MVVPLLRARRRPVRILPMERDSAMQDVTMLFYTALFFAIAFLYVKACQKLR